MKKTALLFSIFLVLFSCKPKDSEDKPQDMPKDSTLVGVDKDKDGCLASAGYTWSKLNKECVRAFTGIQLLPVDKPATSAEEDTAVLAAYVLFNEEGDKAEVFLPDDKSIILSRESKNKPWIFQDYQLIAKNGYVLQKAGKVLFAGDGEVGNKVTGSEEPEGEEGDSGNTE